MPNTTIALCLAARYSWIYCSRSSVKERYATVWVNCVNSCLCACVFVCFIDSMFAPVLLDLSLCG